MKALNNLLNDRSIRWEVIYSSYCPAHQARQVPEGASVNQLRELPKAWFNIVPYRETGLMSAEYLKKTFRVEGNYTTEEALIQMYTKLRPGEPSTVNGGQQILYSRFFDPKRYDLGKVGRYKLNKKLNLTIPENIRVLTPQDTLAAIDYLINLKFDVGNVDDIDHLGNRRVRSVGELLQNQVRIGLNRLERIIRERMTICDIHSLTPNTLVNPKPIIASIREFFGSSQLSQFMDQTNPLAELTHKRRVSS